ncbi:SDR family oxidoreductase [Myceligenerans pegani]|uniref:SDR family oxidoreductase n=1 Tax=Myceligenerans pegani TaxID=2776917 RepID=A0ABR9MYQ1_9MICO|nr:SDR family oxidoreductase [Myceligenerans sp. TRM 65318]MBE1876141.1 SDR family oxidoreductase [Myceligenerans sp. TRM 65318]MBE3018412.1 SDR family oxidoreductase [Myceligenerans sp. TRM 65318]
MKIVVIGGTGLVGSQVVDRLKGRHEVVAASPQTGVDTVTGAGLAGALEGAQVVVDLSNSPSFAEEDATRFFRESTSNLLNAEAQAGVRHHVILSIVGAEGIDSGYMRAKVVQEDLVKASEAGWSIVRSTQFLEFLGSIADAATVDGVVHMAPVRFQPIASADVARIVAEVAAGAPLAGTVEIAGPKVFAFDEIVRTHLASHGDRRRVLTDPGATYFGAPLTDGELVPAGPARLGEISYEAWRAAQA